MSKSSDHTNHPRPKWTKGRIVVLAILVVACLLIKPWLEDHFQGSNSGFEQAVPAPIEGTVQPGVPSQSALQEDASALEELLQVERPPTAARGTSGPTIPDAAPVPSAVQPTPKPVPSREAPSPASSSLGELRNVGNNVYVSTAGLRYKPGGADGHRLEHMLKHLEDDLSKPTHGVFSGDKQQVLKLIDEAYLLAQKHGPPQVQESVEDDRTIYTIDMKAKIGYVGGESGQRRRHPACRKLRLVLEGEDVITAFPVQ